MADQPINSLHLTHNLEVAFELFEVRTGVSGLKPIHRTGHTPVGTADAIRRETRLIFDKAFGEEGEQKRANIERLRVSMSNAWAEQGPSRHALDQFIDGLPSS